MNDQISLTIYESVNQQELRRARKFIEDIGNDLTGAPFILNLFAPKGFGKTVLLEHIWSEYERRLPASLVRVNEFGKEGSHSVILVKLLIQMIDQLGERLPRRVASLPSDYSAWTNEIELADLLLRLVFGAKDFEKVTLILIDDYDLVPEKQRRWLQTNVLGPASRTRRVAVVLTSGTELKLTESFDLRMRLECRELTGLDPEAISRAVPEYGGIAGDIYRITGGLPLLTDQFVGQLKNSHVTTSADFQAHAQELTRKYYRTYVEEKFLADITANIREAMQILALLRRFDVKVLKRILPDLLPESFRNYGTADYLDFIDHLQPWVEWRRQGGYALNSAFRLMLAGYVMIIRPDLYRKVNLGAEDMYRKWLHSEYKEHYLIELLYHVLALHRVEANGFLHVQDEMSQAKVGGELLSYLTENGGRHLQDVDLVIALKNTLENDPDLKNHISKDVKREIDELIDQRSTEAKPIIQLSNAA